MHVRRRRGQCLLVAAAGAALMSPLWLLPNEAATAVAGVLHLIALVTALVAMTRSARRGDASSSRCRWALAAALGAVAAGALIGLGYTFTTGSIPVPSIADPVSLLWVPLAVYGFWKVPRRERGPHDDITPRGDLLRLLSDAAVVVTALLFASYLWILEPLAEAARWTLAGEVVELSYPVLDLVVASVVISLLPRARADMRPFLDCVALGLLLVVVSDSGSALLLAERGTASFGWPDVTLQAGMMSLAFAARLRTRPVLVERRASSALDRNLPYLPIGLAAGLALLRAALVGPLGFVECSLAALMLLAIVLRQVLSGTTLAATAESHRAAAVTDALTGLANRKAFLARLGEHLGTPGAGPAAVVLFDLDGFKEVNDTLGHEAGDDVLKAFAATLAAEADGGLAARLGGDEFALLVVAEDDPEGVAREIALRVNELAGRTTHGIRGSAGLARVLPGDTPSDAMRRADLAMYAAKRATKEAPANQQPGVCVFSDKLAARADRRALLLAALPGAAARGELRVLYQPLFRLVDGALTGAEALLRWDHPLLGAVSPDEFIPLAEDSGHILGLGAWVREHAMAQVAQWDGEGRRLPRLFINVAPGEFRSTLPAEVARLLERHRIDPDRVALEITESRLPGPAAVEVMRRLRDTGVHIALDDFGTGYSSLAQLAHLPVDILKIDREFITNLGERGGRPILDAVVNVGRALGLTTVAEGIEHMAQAAEAVNAGLDLAQGYLFSRPLTADDLIAVLEDSLPSGSLVPLPRAEQQPEAAATR